MKRRRLIQTVLGLPAVTALPLPAPVAAQTAGAASPSQTAGNLLITAPEAAGDGVVRFFSEEQFGALRRVCGILVPASAGKPGALEARAPEFLDFLVRESGGPRQDLYRNGLDRLNAEARRAHGAAFEKVTGEQAAAMLAPLRAPWRYGGPDDPFARFLLSVRQDALDATLNSREWAAAGSSRRSAGQNYYWRGIE